MLLYSGAAVQRYSNVLGIWTDAHSKSAEEAKEPLDLQVSCPDVTDTRCGLVQALARGDQLAVGHPAGKEQQAPGDLQVPRQAA